MRAERVVHVVGRLAAHERRALEALELERLLWACVERLAERPRDRPVGTDPLEHEQPGRLAAVEPAVDELGERILRLLGRDEWGAEKAVEVAPGGEHRDRQTLP